MAKPTFVEPITAAQIDALRRQGLSTTSGTLPETEGVVLSYVVSVTKVTFTVEKKPFLVPVSVIQNRVRNLLTEE
jgi:hypothetical protein